MTVRYSTLACGISALALSVSSQALAQTAPTAPVSASPQSTTAQEPAIADIVVTAQKRAENVQQVPISISALGAQALKERQLTDVAAIANVAPSVNLDAGTPFSGSTSVLGAFIRGIGQNDFAINVDPGVGIYLDGVYLARTVGANLDLPDVERIEILKGPQGTLFGRNTIGGAISVVTRDPGKEFSVKGSITTGSYHRLDAQAMIDIPISDTLRTSLTISEQHRDGYARRVPYTQSAPFSVDPSTAFREVGYGSADREGGVGQQNIRFKAKWEPSSRFSATLSADYTHVNQSALPTAVLAVTPTPGSFAGTAANNIPGTSFDPSGISGFNFAGLYNFCISASAADIAARGAGNLCGIRGTPISNGINQPALAGQANALPFDNRWVTTNPDRSYATGPSFSRMNNWGLGLTLNYDLASFATIRSITSYRHLTFSAGLDADNSPIPYLELSEGLTQKQFSQEVQVLGKLLDNKLNYVIGGYYFNETANEDDFANIADGLLQIEGPVHVHTTNYAFFGQLDYRPIDLIGFTLGARYTHEDKDFSAGQKDWNGFNYKLFNCTVYGQPCQGILGFPNPADPLQIYVPGNQNATFNNFSPKFGVQLHPSTNIMAYGSYSLGYKTGGWSTRLQNPIGIAPAFGPEKAKTWEIGLKSQLFDRRLQLNLAAFTTKYEGIQLLYQQGTSPVIQNAGTARIKGIEAEAIAALTSYFKVNASVGYLDAKLTSVLGPAISPANVYQAGLDVGADLPKVPHWKINVSPRLELPVGEAKLIAIVDYTHLSSMWNDSQRTYLLRRPATDTLGASVTYKAADGHWDLTVGGTNITNTRFLVNGVAQIAGGEIYGSYNRPAEWYAKLGFNF